MNEKYSYRYTRFFTDEFPDLLKELDYRDKVVLDLGAGDGEIIYGLRKTGWLDEVKKIIGVEISPMRCKLLKKVLAEFVTKTEMYCADAQYLRGIIPDGSIDIVICNQVIEHCESDDKVIAEIFRMLKPGGVCYLSTVFKKKFNFAYHRNEQGKRTLDPTHLREYAEYDNTSQTFWAKLHYLFRIEKDRCSLQWFAITDFILGRLKIMGHIYENVKWLAWLRNFKLPIVGCMNWEFILIKPTHTNEGSQKPS